MTYQRVQVFSIGSPPRGTPKERRRYRVRWRIDGRDRMRRFKTKAEAERFRSRLQAAAVEGDVFDPASGLPSSWLRPTDTWWSWSRQWLALKWPTWAGHSRRSAVETLVAITPYLVRSGAPDVPPSLTSWLWRDGYQSDAESAGGMERSWLERWSIPLVEIRPSVLESALTAATTKRDGRPNAANVIQRRRNMVKSILKVAVRRGLLEANPMDHVEWTAPQRSVEVDISLLPSLADVDEITSRIVALRSPGARFGAFFAAIGFAGLRPSEAAALQVVDLQLPDTGWGIVHLRGAIPSPGTRFTNSGETRERKGLKHRPQTAVREVPLPPPLVERLRNHLRRWPPNTGLVFTNAAGRSVTPENYGRVWNREKGRVWPEGHRLSATDPYDLRHTAATAMIRAGVPLPEIGRRLGHSVDVLLRVYAGVFDDDRQRSNTALEAEFERNDIR